MNFFAQILRQTPKAGDPAPKVQNIMGGIDTYFDAILGNDDEDLSIIHFSESEHGKRLANSEAQPVQGLNYTLEPFFLMIEYTDASGSITRRRITTRSIDERGGVYLLNAFCHEREALRQFRLDRIGCLISQHGEIEDAAAFFRDVLATAECVEKEFGGQATRPVASAYTVLRRITAPGLTILLATARSDDYLHPRELDAILRWVEDESFAQRDAGQLPGPLDADDFSKFERTIRRLRPTRDDLLAALRDIAPWTADSKRRLARAIASTARADGRVDEVEAAIIDSVDEIGTASHGFGWMN